MSEYFGFGDFIFRTPDGVEVGRAGDLKSLEELLKVVPDESLRYHGERNHFSRWLKARTEFWLAHQLRPRKVSDYSSISELRESLISSLQAYRRMQQRGLITDFQKESFDPQSSFARIGGGSLGGKARGLGFLSKLIAEHGFGQNFARVEVSIPSAVILGSDVFDTFLEANQLRTFAMSSMDDEEITNHFLAARKFPRKVLVQLRDFLKIVRVPLAVRSSSLLEDSQYQPFAGVYDTHMIPNNHPGLSARLRELVTTIKRVYASTFYRRAKEYIKATSYRLEEEKMAVIVQKMVGAHHGRRYYPNFAGVARSHNFYPAPPQKSSDGVVSVALGLGKMVVEGGPCVRFSPRYPGHLQQFSPGEDALVNFQQEFFALDMEAGAEHTIESRDLYTRKYDLSDAEADGTLGYVGSTYSSENDAISDGISRSGTRLVTFGPLLKNRLFPLPEILDDLLRLTSVGMGTAIEVEFAVNLDVAEGDPAQFGLLQMRPLVVSRDFEEFIPTPVDSRLILCHSSQVLGNGVIDTIHDVILVDRDRFERSRSQDVAQEVGQFNAALLSDRRPYLLIGIGRWGTLDPWLGIPVRWDQISGARAIIESGFEGIVVAPSQGSHFFQNLTSFMIGYFSVNPPMNQGFIDWEWLSTQTPVESKSFTKHLRFSNPLVVRMNGHEGKGVILKPE
jgi:hypothetical protein